MLECFLKTSMTREEYIDAVNWTTMSVKETTIEIIAAWPWMIELKMYLALFGSILIWAKYVKQSESIINRTRAIKK